MSKESKKQAKGKDSKEEQIKELTDDLQRLQAEFENYKKRIDKENDKFKKYAKKELIEKLLPLLDSFELALKNTKNTKEFCKGMELIYSQFFSILEKEGLKKIDAVGKKYDPYKHEVLMQEESDKEEETVLEELQKGYILHEGVLRSAKVKIAKKEEGEDDNQEDKTEEGS